MSGTDRVLVQRRFFEDPRDILLAGLIAVAVTVMGGTWATGQLAGLLFKFTWPHVGIGDGLHIAVQLPHHWSDPRRAWPTASQHQLPGPAGFAVAAVLLLIAVVTLGWQVLRRVRRRRQVRGYASRTQLHRALSEQTALAKLPRLRPLGGATPTATSVAVDLGRAVGSGMRLWASIENTVLLLAPPRQGKTSQIIIPWLTGWDGPALVSSVRDDVAKATMTLRAAHGPVAVLDLNAVWPDQLRWSPVTGCHRFDKARARADVMVAVGKPEAGISDSTNAGFFGASATNLLAGWLHTAALTGRTMTDVVEWAFKPTDREPVALLRHHPDAAPGVAAMLDMVYQQPPETRANLWATVLTAIAPLLSENARDTFCPPAHASFDVEEFLNGDGTIYLHVSETQAADLAPLIAAFVDEIIETVKHVTPRLGLDRLDPPLGLFLDEVANVVPLPKLPAMASYIAGDGIFGVFVFQSFAQARDRWGRDGADMLWGAATVKIALGGLGGDELAEFSKLGGEYRETIITHQHSQQGTTISATLADRRTIAPHEVRLLDEADRQALIVHGTIPIVRTRMTRYHEGPDAERYQRAKADASAQLAAVRSDTAPAGRKPR